MSPVNRHLEWAEVTDFSPGLWTAGSSMQMPATAAQVMTDCIPQPAGGLRAAIKPTAVPTTNLTASDQVVHLFTLPGTLGLNRFLWTYNGTNTRVWRMDSSAGAIVWTLLKTHTAAANATVVADSFMDSAGVVYVVYSLGVGTDQGVWSITVSTNTVTNRLSAAVQVLCVQDDRIIAVTPSTGSVFGNTLRFSDSQSVSSFPAANALPIQVSRAGAVSGVQTIIPSAPSDLLIGFGATPWVVVQGDITSPVVRSMSDARTPSGAQKGVYTPEGLVFQSAETVFVTNDGTNFDDLSAQIATSAIPTGQLMYLDRLLVAGGGYAFDFTTHSWFKLSDIPLHSKGWGNVGNAVLSSAASGTSFAMWDYFAAADSTRKSTYTWKGAPLRRPDGRQVEIREVQVYAETLDASAQIAVTVNGTTRTVVPTSVGKEMHSFLFVERAEVLDVQVVPTAGSAANEAPRVEVVRIGYGKGHQTA